MKVQQLESEMAKTTAAYTTLANSKKDLDQNDSNSNQSNRRGQRQPYAVKPWRLQFKGKHVTRNGMKYTWCTKEHYSGGEKHYGMYTTHSEDEHDAWRKELDEKRAKRFSNTPPSDSNSDKSSDASAKSDAEKKKLALSESLRTALCTQTGLSSEVADRIWNEACRDSGNA